MGGCIGGGGGGGRHPLPNSFLPQEEEAHQPVPFPNVSEWRHNLFFLMCSPTATLWPLLKSDFTTQQLWRKQHQSKQAQERRSIGWPPTPSLPSRSFPVQIGCIPNPNRREPKFSTSLLKRLNLNAHSSLERETKFCELREQMCRHIFLNRSLQSQKLSC